VLVIHRVLKLITLTAALHASAANAATVRELLQRMPGPPTAPSHPDECRAFKKPYEDLLQQINDTHQQCLDAYQGSKVDSGGGPCSYAPCEQYHSPNTQPWYREVQRAYEQCNQLARDAQEQQRAFLAYQREQLAAQAEYQREAQRDAHAAAQTRAAQEAARLDQKREAAAGRSGFFEGAAARNQALLGSTGASTARGTTSVDAALGGSLGSTLSGLRDLLGSSPSTSASSGSGSGPDLLSFVPGSTNLERGSLIAEYLADWSGTAGTLTAAAGAVGMAERVSDVWNTWSSFRQGDVLGGTGGAAAIAADFVLPSHAAFFAVPALNAATAINSAALGELDRAFRDFDQVTSSGQPYIQPVSSTGYAGSFQPVQRAYIESMCDYCEWDEERKAYKVSVFNDLIEVSQDGEISTGWEPVRMILGDR